uniref:Beta-1,6-glucan synthetase n=1 Tax=Pneumocystis carinii TaxID=4754 RepID=Q6UEI2_PNECA|nr:beta-1,6-glucan synthetase [Pneumocystis carinii]
MTRNHWFNEGFPNYHPPNYEENWNVQTPRVHRPLPPIPCHLETQYQEQCENIVLNQQQQQHLYDKNYRRFRNEDVSFPRRRIVSHGDYSEDEVVHQKQEESANHCDYNSFVPHTSRNMSGDIYDDYSDIDYAILDHKRKSYMNYTQELNNDYYEAERNEYKESKFEKADKISLNAQNGEIKRDIISNLDIMWNPNIVEPDDYLHNPATKERKKDYHIFTKRGILNMGSLVILTFGIISFFMGYPILLYTKKIYEDIHRCPDCTKTLPIDLLNATRGLIDPDTPEEFYELKNKDGKIYKLVFSDEFNKNGRTFYPGDDQFWEAVDLHYWSTLSLEWYDPDAITTNDGFLEIRLDSFRNHDLNYRSGMLQSWNKLCLKGGIIEASISLPGRGDTSGLWPAFWMMGNLGRPGFGASTEGTWPYSYDNCDIGITPNQSDHTGLSFLPGMKLPGCTCPNSDHPSPGKGRGAPEIDIIEASVDLSLHIGEASQSVQFAPFDIQHKPNYDHMIIYNAEKTHINPYHGNVFQQTFSCITYLNNEWYNGYKFQTYGLEYRPGRKGYIEWFIGDQTTWKMKSESVGPNGNIGQRLISEEPMAIIINLALSETFSKIEWEKLQFPAIMRIDWVRIYQEESLITCDPPGYPTTNYIKEHPIAYYNNNVTTWNNTGYEWPKNRLMNKC